MDKGKEGKGAGRGSNPPFHPNIQVLIFPCWQKIFKNDVVTILYTYVKLFTKLKLKKPYFTFFWRLFEIPAIIYLSKCRIDYFIIVLLILSICQIASRVRKRWDVIGYRKSKMEKGMSVIQTLLEKKEEKVRKFGKMRTMPERYMFI